MTASHVKIGFLALCLALLLGVPAAILSGVGRNAPRETAVAVEHVAPATMRVARLASSGTNVYDVTITGSGLLAVHLPRSWTRVELRGATLDRMPGEPQEWDYVRWTMPSGATARFEAPDPGRVLLHNPSGIPLTVTTVNLRDGARDEDARIVTNEPYPLP